MVEGHAFDIEKMRVAVQHGRFEWRMHVLIQLLQRNISQKSVLHGLLSGEAIEHYPSSKPYPSSLFLGRVSAAPLHVVVAFNEQNRYAYIITAYEPDEQHFESDFKTRKRKK